MSKNKRVNKKFVEIYENKIKDFRKEYYKNIINMSASSDNKTIFILINIIPIILGVLIVLTGGFSINSHILAIITFIIACIVIKVVFKATNLANTNAYLNELIKYGYYSIEDYENKLKKYITGPNGYYNYLLNELIKQYDISDKTRKVSGIHGELYYIWTNSNQDKLQLLNCRTTEKPEIITIRFVNIRYFRVDYKNKEIVLKTDLDEYYFKLDALDTFNEYIKEKRLENIKTNKPEDYINDFELYMHKIKSDIIIKEEKSKEELATNIIQIICYFIATILLIFTKVYINKNLFLLNLVNLLIFVMLCINIKKLIFNINNFVLNEEDYIRVLNTDEKCKEHFNELKFALGIKDTYDRVYSNEGACYLTWVANGYFHIFLNLIYFNVVYMAIKTSDVLYYLKSNNECIVKLRDKTLTFTRDAEVVFSKILPNKDYKWIKGFKNK